MLMSGPSENLRKQASWQEKQQMQRPGSGDVTGAKRGQDAKLWG